MAFFTTKTERYTAIIVGVFTVVTAPIGWFIPIILDHEPSKIDFELSKCEMVGADVYMGELRNTETGHAKELTLTATLNSDIEDFKVNLNGEMKVDFNKPKGTARLFVQNFPSGGILTFNIVADKKSEVNIPFKVIWGIKGQAQTKPQPCSESIQQAIEVGSNLEKLSHKARETAVKRNDH